MTTPAGFSKPRSSAWDRVTVGLALLITLVASGGVGGAATRVLDGQGASPSSGVVTLPPGPETPGLVGNPVSVKVPAIGVDAELDVLGLTPGGALEVPPYDRAGWFAGGSRPGEPGPAVIAAHVDSLTGPAVFYKLKAVRPGDRITVGYADGTEVHFVVSGSASYPKSEFPTDQVYGPTEGAGLRLITCGGVFDRKAGSYLENLVVWATFATAPTTDVAARQTRLAR